MFHIERPVFLMLILFVTALTISAVVHPYILKISILKNLVDNPGNRKLQKEAVPVMGGAVVFLSIICSLCFFKTTGSRIDLFSTICGMMIMLYLGIIDDILDVKAWKKFLIEIVVCTLVVYGTRNLMGNLGGLFGIIRLPVHVAIPFTVIAMVGIINSINMIDGVDGLSSGICIFAFLVFSLFLFLVHEYSFAALAVICTGALVPFFLHNLFGSKSKMFLGDGGTLMIGLAMSSLVLDILKMKPFVYDSFMVRPERISLASFSLATLFVPVFDTLRVMTVRICHGIPPFTADREHLHHHLIDRGFSHLSTTLTEIALEALILASWSLSFHFGASVTLQMAVVVAVGSGLCISVLEICRKCH